MNAAATLKHWESACSGGARNLLRLGDTLYTWDVNPRAQKNGALVGRVHAQAPNSNFHDIGAYKIRADGSVESVPTALAAILVAAPETAVDERPSAFITDDIEAEVA